MTQGATIYAFPQVQFVKHIVLTPPINLSYCHPFSSKPTKLLLLSVFECISLSLRLRTCALYLMCVAKYCKGVCVFVCVSFYVLSYVHTCMCACLCIFVSVFTVCMCVSVCVINTRQMVQSGHSSSSGAKRAGDAPTGTLGIKNWPRKVRKIFRRT